MNPLVSIIIPVYNTEKYIKESIESALNQTYQEKEIIVVDDGSYDKTPEIISSYSNRLKIITKENGGVSSALNEGIRQSHGEFIHRLDADDVLFPNALEIMMQNILKTPNYKDKIFYSHFEFINPTFFYMMGEEDNHNELTPQQQKEIMLSGCGSFGFACSSLIHRTIFDRIGLFDEMLPYAEDSEFWIRALNRGIKMWLIEEYTAKYRLHGGQGSVTLNWCFWDLIYANYR